jgi:hypothetical protein
MEDKTLSEAEAKVFAILSKNGHVKRRNCDLIGQATWDAFERGFLACYAWLVPDVLTSEILKVGDRLTLSKKGIEWVVIELPSRYSSQVHIRTVNRYNTRCMRMSYRNKYLDPGTQVFNLTPSEDERP